MPASLPLGLTVAGLVLAGAAVLSGHPAVTWAAIAFIAGALGTRWLERRRGRGRNA